MQKYTINISYNGQPRKLIMARDSGESEQHLAMKLLAYLLYFDREPTIELSVGQHYKPDLAIMNGRDVTLWVDCGDVGPHKLHRITTSNRKAEVIDSGCHRVWPTDTIARAAAKRYPADARSHLHALLAKGPEPSNCACRSVGPSAEGSGFSHELLI
jgi:hypothetical protein